MWDEDFNKMFTFMMMTPWGQTDQILHHFGLSIDECLIKDSYRRERNVWLEPCFWFKNIQYMVLETFKFEVLRDVSHHVATIIAFLSVIYEFSLYSFTFPCIDISVAARRKYLTHILAFWTHGIHLLKSEILFHVTRT